MFVVAVLDEEGKPVSAVGPSDDQATSEQHRDKLRLPAGSVDLRPEVRDDSAVPDSLAAGAARERKAMPTTITKYRVTFYGGPNGFGDLRASIFLYDGEDNVGLVRFHDPGMDFPDDDEIGGIVVMHLPSSMFLSVLDVLRNERPILLDWVVFAGFLGTSVERVGEAE